jgi:hypothetical protein
MKIIEVFDPALCCSTGVCGTDVDPKLVRFAADLSWLAGQGVTVSRHNLAQEPADFVASTPVKAALEAEGNNCLPLVLADGVIVTRSIYPTREQLAHLAGVPGGTTETAEAACCGGSGELNADGDSQCCGGSGCCS